MKLSVLLTSLSVSMLLLACSGDQAQDAIDNLREAEAAVAAGDMEVAKSVASKVIGNENMANLPASELARLSLVYMQIADSTERESSIAQAADLYRRAYKTNPDSAAAFYSDVSPDMYPYVTMLRTLVGRLDNPYNPETDSIDEPSSFVLNFHHDSVK